MLTQQRISELCQGLIDYLHRRNRFQEPGTPYRQPHPPNQRELTRLGLWIGIFSISPTSQANLLWYMSHHIPSSSRRRSAAAKGNGLASLLEGLDKSINQHEDAQVQRLALDLIPESVHNNIETILSLPPSVVLSRYGIPAESPLDPTDALAISLVEWFKSDFMNWVDPIKCAACGAETRLARSGPGEVTEQEMQGGAGRTEVHVCVRCGSERRFPRYNDLSTLLRTREGRCGEFANLFQLFLRATSLPARYIWNSEDHVWNTYFSESQNRWIHLDSCEGAWDKPLLYDVGWGKKQNYVLAVGTDGMTDVTRGYVRDWDACLARRKKWREEDLANGLQAITSKRRNRLDTSALAQLQKQDEHERADLLDLTGRLVRAEARGERLEGRKSGTKDWREARKEAGPAGASEDPTPTDLAQAKPMFSLGDHHGQLRLAGSANFGESNGQDSSTLTLTPCDSSRAGWASLYIPVLSPASILATTVRFRMSPRTDQEGADGMALVFLRGDHEAKGAYEQWDRSGRPGFGLGYDGLGGRGDFAVELDTYQSRDHCDDPPTPHISLHSPPLAHHRHSLACTPADTIPSIADGTLRDLRVELDTSTMRVSAWLSVGEREAGPEEWLFLWQAEVPVGSSDQSGLTIMLTAATGGLAQAHEVVAFETVVVQR